MKPDKGLSIVAALALAVLFSAGCDHKRIYAKDFIVEAPSTNSITIYQLAGRLHCQVVKASPACATLQNSTNSLTVFPDPGGAIFVNGQSVASRGQITEMSGTIWVSDDLESSIRPMLRPEPTYASPRPPAPHVAVAPPAPSNTRALRHLNYSGVVVLDAGHGGKDAGAIACNGANEKDIVLPIAQEVHRRLTEAGVRVIMTRDSDEFIELERRSEIANQARADLFVAIHADSAPSNRAATGHTVYVAPGASENMMSMAHCVDRVMEQKGMSSRGIRHARYRVLVNTVCPAMLVEVGYLSNRGEAGQLCSSAYRNQVAAAIAEGILESLRKG